MLAILAITTTAVSGSACIGVGVANAHQERAPQIALSKVGAACAPTSAGAAPCGFPAATGAVAVKLILRSSVPVDLAIPAIAVRTHIQRLGLTRDGSLAVPAPGPRYDEAGWYRYSPTPGALGPAIIVGHLDSATDSQSVFFRLGSLRPRDRIFITRADGSTAIFAVDDVRRYRKSQFPTKLVYGNTKHAALRLITCGGPIDPATGHYRDNLVVWASLVGATGVKPSWWA